MKYKGSDKMDESKFIIMQKRIIEDLFKRIYNYLTELIEIRVLMDENLPKAKQKLTNLIKRVQK